MNKTKIEWTDYTWNPIKGVCPVGCWYCYARRMYKRFRWNPELGMISYNDLQKPRKLKKPSKIFLCSTIEFFHPDIHPSTRECIFDVIKACPHHTFQILTKFPQNIDREMPENVWLGTTVETDNEIERTYRLSEKKARIKFVSFEPLLGWMGEDELDHIQLFNWIIIGKLTQYGKDNDPPKWWIEEIVNVAKRYNIPIFLKDNLKEIWGDDLIQEMPE